MKKEKVEEIKQILKLKFILGKKIDKFLEKNYTEDENYEAVIQRGEDIGFFKK